VTEVTRYLIPMLLLALAGHVGCAKGSTVDEPPGTTSSTSSSGGGGGGGSSTSSSSGDCDPEPSSSGDQCSDALDMGALSDAAGFAVAVTGNAALAGRAVWWSFEATDDPDTAGDEFHVDVRFLTNPGDAYEMAVHRNGCGSAEQLASGETDAFDWYTDFPTTDQNCTETAPCGEGDCVAAPGEDGKNTCDDDTAMFYVRITRGDGAASCDGFELELSNGKYAAP
jgi:hypothetical protein